MSHKIKATSTDMYTGHKPSNRQRKCAPIYRQGAGRHKPSILFATMRSADHLIAQSSPLKHDVPCRPHRNRVEHEANAASRTVTHSKAKTGQATRRQGARAS